MAAYHTKVCAFTRNGQNFPTNYHFQFSFQINLTVGQKFNTNQSYGPLRILSCPSSILCSYHHSNIVEIQFKSFVSIWWCRPTDSAQGLLRQEGGQEEFMHIGYVVTSCPRIYISPMSTIKYSLVNIIQISHSLLVQWNKGSKIRST